MNRIFMQVYVNGRDKAIDTYEKAFGSKIAYQEKRPDGTIGHTEIEIFGYKIAVGESGTTNESITGNTMQFCIQFGENEADKVKKAYEVLRKDGKITVPLGPCMFSSCMADLVDKFGVRWCLYA